MFSKLLVVMAVAIMAVNAQGSSSDAAPSSVPSGATDLSPCALQCVGAAAVLDGCVSPANVTCACTNVQFQVDSGACIQSHCPTDLPAALALQSAECGSFPSVTLSGSPNSIPYTTPPSTATGTSSGASSLASSAPGSSITSTPPASTPTGASSTTSPTTASSATSAASSPTTSSPATSLFANGGVAAVVAMIAGFLAI